MNNYIPEEKTTSFVCPNCEVKTGEKNRVTKEDDRFLCKKCDSSYPNQKEANRTREELKALKRK